MNSQGYTKDNIHKGSTKIVAGGIDVDGLVRIGDQSAGGDGYVLPEVKGTEGQVLTMNADKTTSFQDASQGLSGRIIKNLFVMRERTSFYNTLPTSAQALYQTGYGSNDVLIGDFPVNSTIHIYSRGVIEFDASSVASGTGVFQLEIDDGAGNVVYFTSSNLTLSKQGTANPNRFYQVDFIFQRTGDNSYKINGYGLVSDGSSGQKKMGFVETSYSPTTPYTQFTIKATYYKIVSTPNEEYIPLAQVYINNLILDSSLLIDPPPAPTSHTALTDLTAGDAGHTQFAQLNGRSGGQILSGGVLPIHNLTLKSHDIGLPNVIVKDLNTTFEKNIDMNSNNIINVSEVNNTSNLRISSVGGSLDIDSNLIQFISTAVPQGQIDAVGGWEIFNNLSMTNNNINNVNALQANQVNTDVIENSGSGFLTFTNLGGAVIPSFTSTGLDLNLGEIANVANIKNSGVLNINQGGTTATNIYGNGGFKMQISNAVYIINGIIFNIHDRVIWIPPNQMPSSYLAGYTYIFVGSRTTATTQNINVDCKIMGLGKDTSIVNYTGTTTLFNITDVNVEIQDLTITSSQNDGLPINASNFTLGAFNNGREKILNMKGVQIRNSKRGCQFFGFDLIDLNNCLFTYIESGFTGAPQAFIQFTATSKVQLSSCELLRFYQEASNPTPANFYNGDMVGFRNDPVSLVGIGAINVTGCLLHPQQNQNGLFFDPTLTILENTVSSNTFIDINLNTPTYQVVQINNLAGGAGEKSVIEGNSIVPNLRSQVTYVLSATNTTATDLSVNNPNVLNTGGLAIGLVTQFATLTTAGLITYLKKRSGNFIITASANLEVVAGGAGQQVGLGLRVNGVDVPLAYSYVTLDSAGTAPKQCTLNFTGLANQNDTFELTIFNASGNNNVIASYVNFAGIEI